MNVSIGNAVAVHPRSTHPAFSRLALAAVLVSLLITAGCSTRRLSQPAPVEDRTGVVAPAVVLLPGAENAGKPGYYTVRPGDTLYRIALESGQSPRDLQAWNKLTNPNLIEVGQVLRVVPPAVTMASVPMPTASAPTATGVTTMPVAPGAVASRPLDSTTVAPPAPAAAPTPAPAGADDVAFLWPSQGQVIANFDEAKNKGISIAGRLGDPVVAAADGRVVYTVRNSGGVKERVFVSMTLNHQGRSKQVCVNLNDRSGLTYPMLLGRNWLEDEYMVDVSHEPEVPRYGGDLAAQEW